MIKMGGKYVFLVSIVGPDYCGPPYNGRYMSSLTSMNFRSLTRFNTLAVCDCLLYRIIVTVYGVLLYRIIQLYGVLLYRVIVTVYMVYRCKRRQDKLTPYRTW